MHTTVNKGDDKIRAEEREGDLGPFGTAWSHNHFGESSRWLLFHSCSERFPVREYK